MYILLGKMTIVLQKVIATLKKLRHLWSQEKNNCSCPIKCPFPFKYCPFLAVEWFFTHIKNLYQKWHTHPEISQNRTDLTHCRVLYLEDDSGNYILYLLQHEQVFVRKLNHIEKIEK